jgi:hypothetical protein
VVAKTIDGLGLRARIPVIVHGDDPDADLLQRLFLSQRFEAKRTNCAHRELF